MLAPAILFLALSVVKVTSISLHNDVTNNTRHSVEHAEYVNETQRLYNQTRQGSTTAAFSEHTKSDPNSNHSPIPNSNHPPIPNSSHPLILNSSHPPIPNSSHPPIPNSNHSPIPNSNHPPIPNSSHPPIPNSNHSPIPNSNHPPIPNSNHPPIPNSSHPPIPNSNHPPIPNLTNLWEDGVIPFFIDGNFTADARALLLDAMIQWQTITCVVFVDKTPEHKDYVVFTKLPCGCCAAVGNVRTGTQPISIGNGCEKTGIVLHELGHVIGLSDVTDDTTQASPIRQDVADDTTQASPIHQDVIDDTTQASPRHQGVADDTTQARPRHQDVIGDTTQTSPRHQDVIDDTTLASPRRQDVADDTTQASPIHQDVIDDTTLASPRHQGVADDTTQASPRHQGVADDTTQASPRHQGVADDTTLASPRHQGVADDTTQAGPIHQDKLINVSNPDNGSDPGNTTKTFESLVNETMHADIANDQMNASIAEDEQDASISENDSIMRYGEDIFQSKLYPNHPNEVKHAESSRFNFELKMKLYAQDVRATCELYRCPKCGETLQYQRGNVTYLPSTNASDICQWRIIAGYGEIILFNITGLHFNGSCDDTYLEIRDGPSKSSALLEKLCAGRVPLSVTSKGPLMFIEYRSKTGSDKGFEGVYTFLCGGDITVKDNVYLASPNYPYEYLPDKNCSWNLSAEKGFKIVLRLELFKLEGSEDCKSDYLEVRDGATAASKLFGRYCSHSIPSVFMSTGENLLVTFVSDGLYQSDGFLGNVVREKNK